MHASLVRKALTQTVWNFHHAATMSQIVCHFAQSLCQRMMTSGFRLILAPQKLLCLSHLTCLTTLIHPRLKLSQSFTLSRTHPSPFLSFKTLHLILLGPGHMFQRVWWSRQPLSPSPGSASAVNTFKTLFLWVHHRLTPTVQKVTQL